MRRIAALSSVLVALAVFQAGDEAAAAVKTFRPAADTYVEQARPNRSFGSATRLRARAGSRPAKQVYVRFAVAGLTGSVTRAKLRFYVANGTRNGPAVYRTARWPRKPLTWARRPAVVSGPRDNKGRLRAGAWVEWDVTPWVRRNGAYRFALKRGAADAVRFMSRETRLQPQLFVTTSEPPSTVQYVAPRAGATVSGITAVRVQAPAGTDWVGVYACGESYEDQVMNANGEWSVLWDTHLCSNGSHDLDTWAFRDDGSSLANTTITVEVDNSSPPPPDPEPTPCEPSPAPGPVAGQGYTLRFSDCFGTLSRSVWCSNQWWEPTPHPGTQYAENGALHLVRRRSDGYANVTVSTEPCGQQNPRSFMYGYFEARMRYDTVRGNGPAFWLLSTRHAENGDGEPPDNWPNVSVQCGGAGEPPVAECLSSELDVFEGFGNIEYGGTRTDDFFSGTLHRNSCQCYGQGNQSRFVQHGAGLDLSQWHVYAALWTDSTVSWYIDGELQGSVATFDSTRQPMHLLLYNWNTDWEDENMPNAGTPDQLHALVDWVRVWQQ